MEHCVYLAPGVEDPWSLLGYPAVNKKYYNQEYKGRYGEEKSTEVG